MKRIIILEKIGDYLRMYWKLPELDYPESPSIIDKIIERLIAMGKIKVSKYDKEANIQVIPWIWNEGIKDPETGKFRPASRIFPFPRFDIKSEQELDEYNHWLKTEFRTIVIRMNNSIHIEQGWETIKCEHITELDPIEVDLTQEDLNRLELYSSMLENGDFD